MVTAVEGKLRLPEPPRTGLEAGMQPGAAERATFVLGIFPGEPAASDAMRRLAGPQLGTRHDAIQVSRADFPGAIGARPPFNSLWTSLSSQDGAEIHRTLRGTERLAQHLTRRLAEGASLVIVQTGDSEQRLAVSRALLEAGCEMLLTHEATSSGAGETGNASRTPVMKP